MVLVCPSGKFSEGQFYVTSASSGSCRYFRQGLSGTYLHFRFLLTHSICRNMGTPVRGGMRLNGWSVQTLSSFFRGSECLDQDGYACYLRPTRQFNRNRLRAISSVVLGFSYFLVLLSTCLLSKASVASLVEVRCFFVGQILCSERRSFPLDWQSINLWVSGKREASGLPRQVGTFSLW